MTATAIRPVASQMPTLSHTGSLEQYIGFVNKIPALSAAEEKALAVRLTEQEDLSAAEELVMAHLRFVVHIARGYSGYGLPLNDLIQEGNVGLMKAVKRFDPSHDVRLVSFAVHWIKAEIHEFVLKNWRIVKVATTKAQRKLFFNLRSSKKGLGWLDQSQVKAIANDLGVTTKEVYEMEKRLSSSDMTFDLTPVDEDEHNPAFYLPEEGDTPAEESESDDWQAKTHASLFSALKQLDERSRDIISRRWLQEDDKPTLQDMAAEYGVSAERIRQIETAAIKKLRDNMGEEMATLLA
jgi:RNA polymerase sigma-32 factor